MKRFSLENTKLHTALKMFQKLSRAQDNDDRQFIGYSMVHINSASYQK